MSYVIYLRKSRKDSELEALGIDVLERHEKTLLEYARAHNLIIGGIYREVVSGDSIENRPEMQRLLSEVEAGIWDGVLVMEVERLARGDTIDQGRVQRAFYYSSTLIVTPSKTYDPTNEFDNEYFEFSLYMSRREYATIKRRLQTGRVRSSKDGYYCGNVAPYGWKRIKAQDHKHYTLAPDETEAPIVKLMYDLKGNKLYGYQKICTELRNLGILARNGKPFTPSTIKGIISNPVNIGKIRWNYRKQKKTVENGVIHKSRPKSEDCILVDAAHKGLISEELFQRANTVNSSFSAPVRNDRPLQNVFAGLIYCSCCGRVMVRKKAHTKMPYDYLICQYTGCNTVGIRCDELEEALLSWLREYIAIYESGEISLEEDNAKLDSIKLQASNLEAQHTTLLKQRSSLFDFLEQGIYTKEIFFERSQSLEERIKDCLAKIEEARKELERVSSMQENRASFIPKCKNLLDEWETLDAAGKNTLLKDLIDKVVFSKTTRNTKSKHNSDFSITVYPKLPRK